jgi:hypothetical protein
VAEQLEIPPEFGDSWEDFVRTWYLGSALGYESSEVARALRTLARLWPEKVASLTTNSPRGVGILAPAIELGSMLDTCEAADSFREVFARVRAGERSAYSELVLVAALIRLGYPARFAARIGGRLLDAACLVDGCRVFFEVVAPERSDASAKEQLIVDMLPEEVRRSVSKCRVECELFIPFSQTDTPAVVDDVRSASPSTWVLVDDKARLRRIDIGQTLSPVF